MQSLQQEIVAKFHYESRPSLQLVGDADVSEEYDFQALPIVPTRRVLARFVRLETLPPMRFDEGDD